MTEVFRQRQASAPGFRLTRKKGFHVTFANGYTVSVQFGPGNYCSNYDMRIGHDEERAGEEGSATAETAVWGPDGEMLDVSRTESGWQLDGGGDTVQGHQSANDVLSLMQWAASQPTTVAA